MSFVLLNSPSGEPRRVPNGEVNSFLAQGYRRPDPAATPIVTATVVAPEKVNVNTDSPSRIAKLLDGIGTATVKTLKDNRPYAAIEDLIERVPLPNGASWMKFVDRLEFGTDAPE
jgi:hypothetical protein